MRRQQPALTGNELVTQTTKPAEQVLCGLVAEVEADLSSHS
jgi:hypothetical protein